MNDIKQKSLDYHSKYGGKIEITGKYPLETPEDLGMIYTPGMAYPCLEIAADKKKAYDYTMKRRSVAIVSDGTAVLGFGDIGPEAGLPVMEGKAMVFKRFADIDAFPLCIGTTDPDEIVRFCQLLEPTFAGIHLEDIKAPECFYIEKKLQETMNIPVFHDDQWGTAIVALAGFINALKVVGKEAQSVKVVISGAGAAGIAVAKILVEYGVKNIILLDSVGAIHAGRDDLNEFKIEMLETTNPNSESGDLATVIKGADVFMGLSKAGLLTAEMIQSMSEKPVIFAMANPIPEIMPPEALAAGAAVVATGRADYPNQINNVLAFPGVFRGLLDERAENLTINMMVKAATGLAGLIKEPRADYIIPGAFDEGVCESVASAMKV
jgi:malate dehydrogenase (oxaloacetate-decarboxylating)